MAHVVLQDRLDDAGLGDRVEVTSSGTGGWHVGNPMDRRAAATLTAAGYDATRHRARQYDAEWAERNDLVLAMDADNLTTSATCGGVAPRVRLFRDFDPVVPGGDVPDPYYGGDDGFEEVLSMVERTSDASPPPWTSAARPDRPAAACVAPRGRRRGAARHGGRRHGAGRRRRRLRRHQAAALRRHHRAGEDPQQRAAEFFASEAAGLRWLAEAGGRAVPEVLAADDAA